MRDTGRYGEVEWGDHELGEGVDEVVFGREVLEDSSNCPREC